MYLYLKVSCSNNVDCYGIYNKVGYERTSYTYNGDLLVCESNGTDTIWYTYDENGSPVGIELNGTQYYYIKNVQDDIIGIVDTLGNKVVEYTYNAWGYLKYTTGSLASTVGVKNPLRYRGYYYDVETKLYYLQSRYYDPQTGRFINADDTDYIGADGSFISYNLFAYCNNNPVMNVDSNGKLAIPWQIKVGLAAGVGGAIWDMGKYIAKNFWSKKSTWNYIKGLGKAAAKGFIRGFVVGLLSTIPRAWIYGLIGGTFELIFKIMDGKVKSVGAGVTAFLDGWTKGVCVKALNRLFAKILQGAKCKNSTKEYVKFASSLISSYGISKYFKW